jgi:hypothetical protein
MSHVGTGLMKVRINSILAVMAAFLIAIPNINWAIYLPLVVLFIASQLRSIRFRAYVLLGALFLVLAISMMLEPRSTKYSIFFIVIFVFYLLLADRYMGDNNFRIIFLRYASGFISVAIFLGYLGLPEYLYQSRPEFENYIFGILRQRGLYSEPAYLGYWSALLFFLAYKQKLTFFMWLFASHLILSASTGSLGFLILLFISSLQKFSVKQLIFATVFPSLLVYFFWDFASSKLVSASFENRLFNAQFAYGYISQFFPAPMGLGPIFYHDEAIGITSFFLLATKAFGIFTIPIMIFLAFRARPTLGILPLSFVAIAVGNFWETPILFFMILLMIRNHQSRTNFKNIRKPALAS